MGEGINRAARRFIENTLARSAENNQPICLDSSALIANLAGEPPRSYLVRLILTHPDVTRIISTVSLTESMVRPARSGDLALIEKTWHDLRASPRFIIVAFDQEHALEAAIIRAETGFKFPDAVIVATARLANAFALIGNDRQWLNKQLGVTFLCIDDILSLQ